jgi:hypothetical protein
MVYAGLSSFAYWGVEATELAGDPTSDQNIPFNKLKALAASKPAYTETAETTFDKLLNNIVWTSETTPSSITVTGVFRDPFLLLTLFTKKTVAGTWLTGNGTIAGDFTATTHTDSIWIQTYLADQASTDHIGRLSKGGHVTSYAWIIETGKYLVEEATIACRNWATGTTAMTCNNSFHDQAWGSGVGGWANWDASLRPSSDCVIHWNNVVLPGISIKSARLQIDTPHETDRTFDSLHHNIKTRGVRKATLSVTGKLTAADLIEEGEKTYANKHKYTLKVYYDATSSYTKYIQITNMALKNITDPGIPEAGKAAEVTATFETGEDAAITFAGTYYHLADPDALITD